MGLFVREDIDYDESVRMTGFNRYKQLLSFYATHWIKINVITVVSAIPLAFLIGLAILNESVLILLPASFVGGMILGPFLSGLVDSIHRGLRDDPNNRNENYKKALKQNFKCSLLPGGILGLIIGCYSFMFMLIYWSSISPSKMTIAIIVFSLFLTICIFTLYWPHLVLFEISFLQIITNIILFTSKYLWKMILVAILQLLYWGVYILFAPLSLIILPFIGIWYILFLTQFIIYDSLNNELNIEKLHSL